MASLAMIEAYIAPIIVLACLCVGWVIKNCIPNQTVNRFIPLIVMILGIIFNFWSCGAFNLEVAVTGAISGLLSTGLYELFSDTLGKLADVTKEKVGKHERTDSE